MLKAAENYAPFFAPMRIGQAALAPDGQHVAYVTRAGDDTSVVIVDVDSLEVAKTVSVPAWIERAIARVVTVDSLIWPDARHLAIASDHRLVHSVDLDGEKETQLDAKDVAVMVPSSMPAFPNPPRPRALRVLDQLPETSGTVYVEALGDAFRGNSFVPTTLFQLDVATGRRTAVAEAGVAGYLLYDQQGHARILQTSRANRTQSFQYSPRPKGWVGWQDLDQFLGSTGLVFQVTPENNQGSRSFPLAFDYDPNVLYFASNVGRDTFGLYALDLRTKRRTAFAIEDPHRDLAMPHTARAFTRSPLIFDRYRRRLAGARLDGDEPRTRWLDDELAAVQAELDAQFSQRYVELCEWDEHRERYLVLVTSASDPGRYYIYNRRERLATELVRRMPWLTADELHRTESFAFDTAKGVHLSGYVTLPSQPRITPPPLVVLCHDGPWSLVKAGYNADAQALATMGLTVLQVNYRGSSGFGTAHRNAISGHLDGPPVEDLAAAVDWVAVHFPVDQKRIALFGEQFGGYLALRTLETYPAKFRCAVTINAPTRLARWLNEAEVKDVFVNAGKGAGSYSPDQPMSEDPHLGPAPPRAPIDVVSESRRAAFHMDAASLEAESVITHADQIVAPLFLIQTPNRDIVSVHALDLRAKLRERNVEVEYWELDATYPDRLPQGRAELFARIEEYFNLHLYHYNVKVGEPVTVPD